MSKQSVLRHQRSCQLNSIIPPEAVSLRQFYCPVNNSAINLKKNKMLCAILKKTAQQLVSLVAGNAFGRSVFGGQDCRNFCHNNLGDQDRMLRRRICNVSNPAASWFFRVPLHQGTGVTVICRGAGWDRPSILFSARRTPGINS